MQTVKFDFARYGRTGVVELPVSETREILAGCERMLEDYSPAALALMRLQVEQQLWSNPDHPNWDVWAAMMLCLSGLLDGEAPHGS
jgi:hypothetical protein